MRGRIIVVSNRLPLNIVEKDGQLVADRSIGGLATALSAVFSRYEPLWVGWTGLRKVLPAEVLQNLDLPKSVVPVQLPKRLVEYFYDTVSNRAIWPVLHGLEPAIHITDADWDGYLQATKRFATTIRQLIQPDDVLWLHDLHLLMLPAALRELGVENKIGFFLHSPFPPEDYFLRLPQASQFLSSLCQVDVLGLQTAPDADAFWETLKTARLMDQPGLVRVIPIGIDYLQYQAAAARSDVQKRLAHIKAAQTAPRNILSISRLDYTKGIIQQLRAVERFLQQQPEPQQFSYTLVVAPSRETVPEYRQLKREIAREVTRINKHLARPGWLPVDYHYENIPFVEVTAQYLAADVLLLAPIADGMNLIAKEFVATKAADGMLVISRTMGAAYQLREAVQVDPTDVQSIADGLQQAFTLAPSECRARAEQLRAGVQAQDVFWWAERFMRALEA